VPITWEVRNLRSDLGISQAELARATGINQTVPRALGVRSAETGDDSLRDRDAAKDGVLADVGWYRDFLGRMRAARRVVHSVEDKREIAEMVVLRLCARWEYYIDELLVARINCELASLNIHLKNSAKLCWLAMATATSPPSVR